MLKYKIFFEELKSNSFCCMDALERACGGLRDISISSSGIGLVDTTVSMEVISPEERSRERLNIQMKLKRSGRRRILFLLFCSL